MRYHWWRLNNRRGPRTGSVAGSDKSRSGASSPTQSENRSTERPTAVNAIPSSPISAGPRGPASVSGRATSPPDPFIPVVPNDGGFPTHADTIWGDPIATALASPSKSSTGDPSIALSSAVGADTGDRQVGGCNDAEAGQGQGQEVKGQTAGMRNTRGARGGRKALRRGGATASPAAVASASEDQDVAASVAVPAEPDVTLPPGGRWCADEVTW